MLLEAERGLPSLVKRHFLAVVASKEVKGPFHREDCQCFDCLPFDRQLLSGWSSLSCNRCCHYRPLFFSSSLTDEGWVALGVLQPVTHWKCSKEHLDVRDQLPRHVFGTRMICLKLLQLSSFWW